jgi:excisionase family DNA binding protein
VSELALPIPAELLDAITAEVTERVRATLRATAEPWPRWMKIDTAARYLDCTPGRLRKLVQRDQIPHIQDGPRTRVFFDRDQLDRWMTRHTPSP